MNYTFTLTRKEKIALDTYQFFFISNRKIRFVAGQYLEWHLPHPNVDSRGDKRYFTIASSPTEPEIMLATKIISASSSYKKALLQLKPGAKISANELDGDFILPQNNQLKLLFVAGGIGITPYRSMVKFLIDSARKQDIILLYLNKTPADIIFKDVLGQGKQFGVKTIDAITQDIPVGWTGKIGFINPEMIRQAAPDWRKRMVYISGPEKMVEALEKILLEMGVKDKNFKRDYFDNYTETYQPQ